MQLRSTKSVTVTGILYNPKSSKTFFSLSLCLVYRKSRFIPLTNNKHERQCVISGIRQLTQSISPGV